MGLISGSLLVIERSGFIVTEQMKDVASATDMMIAQTGAVVSIGVGVSGRMKILQSREEFKSGQLQ